MSEENPRVVSVAEDDPVTRALRDWEQVALDLRRAGPLKPGKDDRFPFLKVFAASTADLPTLARALEQYFGAPFKGAGEWGFWHNWFDPLVKATGGIQTNQTLYRKKLNDDLFLYCAFWPWASDPDRTSVRLGILCFSPEKEQAIADLVSSLTRKK